MRTLESLKAQVRALQQALAQNGFELRQVHGKNLWLRESELLAARAEIYKSICHRQYLMVEMLETVDRFEREAA